MVWESSGFPGASEARLTERTSAALVFGEHDNDRSALVELVIAIRPETSNFNFRKLREPPVYLRKGELPATRRKSAASIAGLVAAAKVISNLKFVVTHQDCDAVEPAHEDAIESAKSELAAAGVDSVVIATPAFEIEAWWMLFPRELKKVRPGWRPVDYGTQNVGLIQNAKDRLICDLRPDDMRERSKCRDYQESDSIAIAKKIRETGAAKRRTKARSKSFEAFKEMVEALRL
jgi:hypothetical protein